MIESLLDYKHFSGDAITTHLQAFKVSKYQRMGGNTTSGTNKICRLQHVQCKSSQQINN